MSVRILIGDVFEKLRELPDESVHCVITSPPYWGLRCYGVEGQIGLEPTLGEHIDVMVKVFAEIRRVLRKDGTVWLNYGDCYATQPNGRSAVDTKAAGNDDRTFRDKPFSTVGPICEPEHEENDRRGQSNNLGAGDGSRSRVVAGGYLKPKDLCMVPNRLAIALQEDGWWVRSEIIWAKPNPMPESITDRPGTSHEKIFLLTKSSRYFYDAEAVREASSHDPEKFKSPDGWDTSTGHGGHGSIHRVGREKGKVRVSTPRHDGHIQHTKLDVTPRGYGRNLRNVWNVATRPFSEAHFATFPPDIVEPCIKAGTSERGVCPECGAGWVREIERGLAPTGKAAKTFVVDGRDEAADSNDQGSNRQKDGHKPGHISANRTIGWKPNCACVHLTDGPPGWEESVQSHTPEPVPATVLDPFGGAGTTALVADRLGRDSILIELNPEYAAIAQKRIEQDGPLFAEVS